MSRIVIKKPNSSIVNIIMALLCMVIYVETTIFAPASRITILTEIVLSFALIVMVLISNNINIPSTKIRKKDLLCLALIMVVLFFNADIANKEPSYEVIFLTFMIVLIFGKKNRHDFARIFLNFYIYWGFINACITVACAIKPELYINTIFINVGEAYRDILRYAYYAGYQPSIAKHYSTNGIYMSLFAGVSFVRFLCSDLRKEKRIYMLLVVFAIIGLLLTGKRGHTVFTILSLFFVYYLNQRNTATRLIKSLGALLLIFTVFDIVISFIPELGIVFDRIANTDFSNTTAFTTGRIIFYKYAIELFRSSPIVGHGWNSFKYLALAHLGTKNAVHNVYLQLLAETGVVGFLLFIMFFISNLYGCYFSLKKVVNGRNISRITKENVLFSLFFQMFFLLYCFTGSPLYDTMLVSTYLLFSSINISED